MNLTDLLNDSSLAGTASVDELPLLIAAVSRQQAALAVVLAALTTRLLVLRSSDRPAERLLKVEEAAQLLAVTPNYLYHHAGELPFTRRIGSQLRFSAAGIGDYIKRRAGGP